MRERKEEVGVKGALHRAGPAVSPLEQPVAFQTSPSAASPLTLPLALPPSPRTGACRPPWWTGRCHSGAVAPGGLPPCTGPGGTGTAGQNSQSTCRHTGGVSGGWWGSLAQEPASSPQRRAEARPGPACGEGRTKSGSGGGPTRIPGKNVGTSPGNEGPSIIE